jgi:hypothetical protein
MNVIVIVAADTTDALMTHWPSPFLQLKFHQNRVATPSPTGPVSRLAIALRPPSPSMDVVF